MAEGGGWGMMLGKRLFFFYSFEKGIMICHEEGGGYVGSRMRICIVCLLLF